MTRSSPLRLSTIAFCTLAVSLALGCSDRDPPEIDQVVEVLADNRIRFPARVNAAGFEDEAMPGYHAIVWQGGRAAEHALFQAEVTDVQVLDALEALGVTPGDNLSLEAWEKRHDENHPAPKELVTGPHVSIGIELPGDEEIHPLSYFLEDSGAGGVEMRVGGNRRHIPAWKSACVVCLYSCPGSKVGNASYTVRDYVEGVTSFRALPERLPSDGSRVWIYFTLI